MKLYGILIIIFLLGPEAFSVSCLAVCVYWSNSQTDTEPRMMTGVSVLVDSWFKAVRHCILIQNCSNHIHVLACTADTLRYWISTCCWIPTFDKPVLHGNVLLYYCVGSRATSLAVIDLWSYW